MDQPSVPWRIERRSGGAGSLFADSEPVAPARRTVRVLEVSAPALVLGSTQAAPEGGAGIGAGVEVVRRRSGGGGVLLRPGETVWVDVVVPAGDPLWDDDVGRAFHWLGDVWAAALATVGVDGRVHRGPLVASRWSAAVCFAGVGAGEVVVGEPPAKVVGIASRRTRRWALFQCAVPLTWDVAAHVDLLGLPPEAAADLAAAVHPLAGPSPDAIVAAFLAALP